MIPPVSRHPERGATLAVMALLIVLLLGAAAFAIDLGMIRAYGTQAQRAADAAALAGASAFVDYAATDPQAVDSARARAVQFGTSQTIGHDTIQAAEESVAVVVDSTKVHVWITRNGVPTWFANILGISSLSVRRHAAAIAEAAGTSNCLKPIAMPDLWAENSPPSVVRRDTLNDYNRNRIWDPHEFWTYNAGTDSYGAYDPTASPAAQALQTGYGTAWRNGQTDASGQAYTGDFGRQLVIKPADPNSPSQSSGWSPFFYMWQVPTVPGAFTGSPGSASYISQLIQNTDCSKLQPVSVGTQYTSANGNMVGPIRQAFGNLISLDPGATWDGTANGGQGGVVGSSYGSNWRSSPRVVTIGLFNPGQIAAINSGGLGNAPITFNNFALMFLDHVDNGGSVYGRFLFFASGSGNGGGGNTVGSLVKTVKLVQ